MNTAFEDAIHNSSGVMQTNTKTDIGNEKFTNSDVYCLRFNQSIYSDLLFLAVPYIRLYVNTYTDRRPTQSQHLSLKRITKRKMSYAGHLKYLSFISTILCVTLPLELCNAHVVLCEYEQFSNSLCYSTGLVNVNFDQVRRTYRLIEWDLTSH